MLIINQRRVLSLGNHLPTNLIGKKLQVALLNPDRFLAKLKDIGFSSPWVEGEAILPSPKYGSVSKFNAEGGFNKIKHLPKEKCYRSQEWTRKEWHGKDTVDVTDVVYIEYERYQREEIPAPSIELVISKKANELVLTTDAIVYDEKQPRPLMHVINLFLELFGDCVVLDEAGNLIELPKLVKVNWEMFPEGEYPWDKVKPFIEKSFERTPPKARAAIVNRMESINEKKPSFFAIGRGGFSGYVVFGFPERKMYVMECRRTNNATYIFDKDWVALSQLTKAEILEEKLHKQRVIHSPSWLKQINSLFAK